MGVRDLNPCFYAHAVSTLPTESSLQPLNKLSFKIKLFLVFRARMEPRALSVLGKCSLLVFWGTFHNTDIKGDEALLSLNRQSININKRQRRNKMNMFGSWLLARYYLGGRGNQDWRWDPPTHHWLMPAYSERRKAEHSFNSQSAQLHVWNEKGKLARWLGWYSSCYIKPGDSFDPWYPL